MKKKNFDDESETEFDVDEPEELQEHSDDEWAPKGNKRGSGGKRGSPAKKKKRDSSDEDEDEDEPKKKKGVKGKTPVKGKATKGKKLKEEEEDDEDLNEEEIEDEELDDEDIDEEEEEEEEENTNDGVPYTAKEFSSGAFVVLKTDITQSDDPPIWRIDGKALLQKYVPFDQDGSTLYKNTSVYSGWTLNNKDLYYPATVVFKQQTRKEHVVEFQRDLIPKEETPVGDKN